LLIANGVDYTQICLKEGLDAAVVLGATMRAIPFDDFIKAVRGQAVKVDKQTAAGENQNAIMQLAGMSLSPKSKHFIRMDPALRQRLLSGKPNKV
jgi:hypothetical protein